MTLKRIYFFRERARDVSRGTSKVSDHDRMSFHDKPRDKVIQRITDNFRFRLDYTCPYGEHRNQSVHDEPRAKIHVFCPPLLQYIQFALALAPPDEVFRTSEFNMVIHPDDRLLDRAIYSAEEGYEACRSYMLLSVLMQDWGSQMTVSVRAWSASATLRLALTKFGWIKE